MSENNKERQIFTHLSTELYQQIQVFATSRNISESEAIAIILSDYFQTQQLSSLHPCQDSEEFIEDEPDEILWGFLEPESKRDSFDPELFDEPDEVLTGFMDYCDGEDIS